jgi:hypothetical protein
MASTPHADNVTLEQVMILAEQLRPVDQARLVARLATKVEQLLDTIELDMIEGVDSSPAPRPLRGLFADLGTAPSTEEIDQVQQEMWAKIHQEENRS